MKKLIALVLTLALAIGLYVGCSNQPAEPAASGSDTPVLDDTAYNGETLSEGLKLLGACTDETLTVDDPRLDEVVATCGDYSLTNRELQYYFWMEFLNFVNGMSSYGVDLSAFGLDTSKPLAEQQSLSEGLTWEQYFLNSALNSFRENASVATIAKAEGFTLPEEAQSYIDSLPEELEAQATNYGYDDALTFVQQSFGPAATVESYRDYIQVYYTAGYYENELYEKLDYTEEEITAYFNENAESFAQSGVEMDNDVSTMNVRHILIKWEDADGDGTPTDEEKAAALEKAEAILEEYSQEPAEDKFSALANEHSEDPGSNTNGGLYENVYPGQMVEAFNDWCFDENRQPGDTGIVETEYGYHIMFYVSKSDTPYWMEYAANNGFLREKMNNLVTEMGNRYDISVLLNKIVLGKAKLYG